MAVESCAPIDLAHGFGPPGGDDGGAMLAPRRGRYGRCAVSSTVDHRYPFPLTIGRWSSVRMDSGEQGTDIDQRWAMMWAEEARAFMLGSGMAQPQLFGRHEGHQRRA